MMKIKLSIVALLLSVLQANAQIEIPVSTEMFVQLVFKSPIQSVKSGNPEKLLTEYTDNSLTLQAIFDDFRTNISVKTADGLYYSYIVKGTEEKKIKLFYQIATQQAVNLTTTEVPTETTTSEKKNSIEKAVSNQDVAEKLYDQKGFIRSRNIADYKRISLKVKGIYVSQNKLYFLMEFSNDSNIGYRVERIRFATMPIDKSKKRIQSDEREYEPLFFYNHISEIKEKATISTVAVFNKFTLNDNKNLEITLIENEGERTVRLIIPNSWISDAREF